MAVPESVIPFYNLSHIALVAAMLIYFFLFSAFSLVFYLKGRLNGPEKNPVVHSTFTSVIIPVRNEEKNLPAILSDLQGQSYPKDNFEVIIVDDHSYVPVADLGLSDRFPELALRYVLLPDDKTGKKSALHSGARHSKAGPILFTDADCRLNRDWIKLMVYKLISGNNDLLIGLVDYLPKKGGIPIFSRFDFLAMVISGAASALLKFPTICNGANMAVKRDVYLETSNMMNKKNPSGDDVFLLHEAVKSGKRIDVAMFRSSIVLTAPPNSLSEFLSQRIRWASKSKYYRNIPTIALGCVVLFGNTGFLLSIALFTMEPVWSSMLFAIVPKILADCLILTTGLNFFGNKRQMIYFLAVQIIYPIYIIVSFLWSLFLGFTWKGRRYRPTGPM